MDKQDLKNIKLWLFDMDGTLYLGDRLYDFTIELLQTIRATGGKYLFMTNNSSKSVVDYVKKLEKLGITGEPTVMDSVKAGVDILSFSGDKLLGGPQAGIILCKKEWIAKLKKHPLTRAMRVDKMTLAALEATLDTYLDPEKAQQEIPTIRMLAIDPALLKLRAEALYEKLTALGMTCQVIPEQDQVGGGSVPTQLLPTWAVAVDPQNVTVDGLEERLRKQSDIPIIGRIVKDRYLLDTRTLWEEDFDYIAQAVKEADQ